MRIGIGGGALEMLVTGAVSVLGLLGMFGGGPKSDQAQFLLAYDMAVTPLLPLADPVILAVQTICGVAATTLVVHGLRTRSSGPVFGGMVIFGAVLTAVGASRTLSLFGSESRWAILAVLAPVAAWSYVLLRRNLLAWVESPREGETALDAFTREHEAGID